MKRILLLPLLITAASGEDGDDLKQADLAKLLDPAACPGEAARLADCDGKERLLTSFRLHRAPQKDAGGELLVLAAAYDYHFESSIGSDREYPVEQIYRDVRLLRLYEGTSEIQQLIIGSNLMKQKLAEN